MDFKNKTVVVTGAAGGIGKAIIKSIYEKDGNVVLVDIDEEALESAKKELNLDEDRSLIVSADITSEEDTENYIKKAEEKFDSIYGLANVAGISGQRTPIDDLSVEDFDKIYNINLKGTFLGIKHAVKSMKRNNIKGSIVNVSSVAGLIGYPELHPYVSTKHAVRGITKSSAIELAEFGIRVNAISPAQVDTQLQRRLDEKTGDAEAARKELANLIPLARYAESEEIAQSVRYLLSDESSYVTGSTLTVDGGLTIQ